VYGQNSFAGINQKNLLLYSCELKHKEQVEKYVDFFYKVQEKWNNMAESRDLVTMRNKKRI